MKKIILVFSLSLLASACTPNVSLPQQSALGPTGTYSTLVYINGQQLYVDKADSEAAKERGLSGRQAMADNQGMLFDFTQETNRQPQFWMKDMKFSLDLVWIKDNKITGITASVPPPERYPSGEGGLAAYSPPGDIDFVLEVVGGWCQAHNVKIGDELIF